jgi:chemotaxis protein histidine kinase CheA/ActR/RegA family two-component response regulator
LSARVELGEALDRLSAQLFDSLSGLGEHTSATRAWLASALLPIARRAKAAGLEGFTLLLAAPIKVLSDKALAARPLDELALVDFSGWLGQLRAYLDGLLTASEVPTLVEDLARHSYMPPLAAALKFGIEKALLDADWLAPETAAEAPLGDRAVADAQLIAASDSSDQAAAIEEYGLAASPPSIVAATPPDFVEPSTPAPELFSSAAEAPEVADAATSEVEKSAAPASYDPREQWSMQFESTQTDLDRPLWIAPEEIELLAQALTAQVLPVAHELLGAEAEARAEALGRIADETRLVGQAFEVMHLSALNQVVEHLLTNFELLQADLDNLDPALGSGIAEWPVLMLGALERPQESLGREALADSLMQAHWPLPLPPEIWAQVEAELARIQFGIDPALIAARKVDASPEDVELNIDPEVAPQVLSGMLQELPGNVAELSARVHALVKSGNEEDIDVARRVAHTLKGDANIVGLKGIANITHALEDVLVEMKKQPFIPGRELADALIEASDCVEAMSDFVLKRGPYPDSALDVYHHTLHWANVALDRRLQATSTAESEARSTTEPPRSETAKVAAGSSVPLSPVANTEAPPVAASLEPVASMNVPVPVLDQLLRLAGETMVLTRQLEQQIIGLTRRYRDLETGARLSERLYQELDELVAVRGASLQSTQKKGGEVDPLELDQYNDLHTVSKRLQETNSDQKDFVSGLSRTLNDLRELMAQQDQLQGELQSSVLRTRMVPVESVTARFKRAVRQTARSLLKECELEIIGERLEIDSDILAGLTDPLMHALRNSVDHGIEAVSDRVAAGKPEAGLVRLRFAREGAFVRVDVSDDGRGLNLDRIRSKAQERGLLPAGSELTETELQRLILLPGFSTRDETTQISGRGIGMDVVASEVRALNGTLELNSEAGKGMRLTMRVPASLLSAQVLVCNLPGGRVGLASDRIERIQLVQPFELAEHPGGARVMYLGQYIPAYDLDALCFGGDVRQFELNRNFIGVLVRSTEGKPVMALAPNVGDTVSVLVKSLGRYAPSIPGVRGASVLGDGSIAVVVDLPDLIADRLVGGNDGSGQSTRRKQVALPRALIADDSLSVRRALTQLLKDAGFEVQAVRDGLEALGEINRAKPDVLLVDLEMPKLNGLEVSSFVRQTDGLKDIPIIMITSRSGERHQQMATEAGVSQLMTKPYSDDFLLASIERLIRQNAG